MESNKLRFSIPSEIYLEEAKEKVLTKAKQLKHKHKNICESKNIY